MFRALIRRIQFLKIPKNTLECMNVILLHSNYRHVSATHVATRNPFRVVYYSVYMIAHRPGSQFTTCILYLHHPRQYASNQLFTF
jgi:hypothetical protein